MRQSCNSLNVTKNSNCLLPMEILWKIFKEIYVILLGNYLMEIGLNWLGSICKKIFARFAGTFNISQNGESFRKFRKIYQKSKTHCVLSSLQLGLNLSNSTVVTFYFVPVYFFHRKQKKTHLCLFICERWNRQTLVSRLKYWLWLAAAALGYSIEMREIFFENWNKILLKDLIEYFFPEPKTYFFWWHKY